MELLALLLIACWAFWMGSVARALLRVGDALQHDREPDLRPTHVQIEAAAEATLTEPCDVRIGPDRITTTWK